MIRRLAFGSFLTAAVIVGLLAQVGAYLLALTSPGGPGYSVGGHIGAFGKRGPHAVGMRRLSVDQAPMAMTLWYPALEQGPTDISPTYSYAVNILSPDSSIALASYKGHAEPQARLDLPQGPYPLVILSHGFAITGSSYAWLAEHLASYGMVVVAPHHRESLDPGVLWRSTVDRPRDILTVLAYVDAEVRPGGEFEGLIDSQTVAVVGHSYGGYTALAAAGARIDTGAFNAACETARATEGPLVFLCNALQPRLNDMGDRAGLGSLHPSLWPALSDPRVDAVVAMAGDAAMFGEQGLAEVTVPVMALGGTADTDSPFDWGTRLTYDNVSSVRKVEVALEDAAHLIFAGECEAVRRILTLVSLGFCSDPVWDRHRAHDLVRHYVTAFLLAELGQDQGAAAALAPDGHRFSGVGYRAEGY